MLQNAQGKRNKGEFVAKPEYDVKDTEPAWGHPFYGDWRVRRWDPDLGVLWNEVDFLVGSNCNTRLLTNLKGVLIDRNLRVGKLPSRKLKQLIKRRNY